MRGPHGAWVYIYICVEGHNLRRWIIDLLWAWIKGKVRHRRLRAPYNCSLMHNAGYIFSLVNFRQKLKLITSGLHVAKSSVSPLSRKRKCWCSKQCC